MFCVLKSIEKVKAFKLYSYCKSLTAVYLIDYIVFSPPPYALTLSLSLIKYPHLAELFFIPLMVLVDPSSSKRSALP